MIACRTMGTALERQLRLDNTAKYCRPGDQNDAFVPTKSKSPHGASLAKANDSRPLATVPWVPSRGETATRRTDVSDFMSTESRRQRRRQISRLRCWALLGCRTPPKTLSSHVLASKRCATEGPERWHWLARMDCCAQEGGMAQKQASSETRSGKRAVGRPTIK